MKEVIYIQGSLNIVREVRLVMVKDRLTDDEYEHRNDDQNNDGIRMW